VRAVNDTSRGARDAAPAADAVSAGEKAEAASRWRYRLTLLLFAIFAAAVVLWFQRHVEPFVTETLIVGGTVSAWGLWKLIWSMYEDAGGDGRKDLTRRLLGGAGALPAVVFGLIIVALLHAGTSSVYLRYGGARPNEEEFRVQVMDGDHVFMGPYTLGPGTSIGGRPMFPRFRALNLSYQILDRPDFEPLALDLAPWSAHDLDVPGDFPRKRIHVLKFVPGAGLFSDLRKAGEGSGTRHYMEVRAQGKTALLDDLLQAVVVTGAIEANLPRPAALRRIGGLEKEITDYFKSQGIADLDAVVGGLLDADGQTLASAELKGGEEIDVEIGINGAPRQIVVTCRLKVPDSMDERHTFFLGPGERGCQ